MSEADLKGRTLELWHAHEAESVVFCIEAKGISGIPDVNLNCNKKSSWWEFKYARPSCDSKKIQELTACHLAKYSFCRYVIFYENDGYQETRIVHPYEWHIRKGWTDYKIEASAPGLDYQFVVDYMRRVHR